MLHLERHARWVADYYPVESVEELGDGRLEARLRVGDPRWLVRLALRVAPGLTVVEPRELREEVARTARATLGAVRRRSSLSDRTQRRYSHPTLGSGRRRSMTDMTHALALPLSCGLGTTELLIIVGILVLLFGAKKLPELARGSGRALRIFKAETKGLIDDDDDDETKTPEQTQIDAQNRAPPEDGAQARDAQPEDPGTPASLTPETVALCPSPASSSCSVAAPVTRSVRAAGCRSATTSASCAPASCGRRSTWSSARSSRCSSTTSSST